MRHRTQKHQIDSLIALLLFGVFAACVLSVLLTGADVYHKLVQRDQAAYDARTCVQYVATKVRQAPNASQVRVEDFEGVDCLTFTEEWYDEVFSTQIYCYDGWLMELFTFEDSGLLPSDGEKVVEAEAAHFTLEDGLLTIQVRDSSGQDSSLVLSLRGDDTAAYSAYGGYDAYDAYDADEGEGAGEA